MSNKKTNRIEYKRELNDKLERTVVSFLNYTGGGELIIGIDNDGLPVGITDVELVEQLGSGMDMNLRMKAMQESGILKRVGSTRGRWEIL